VNLLATSSTFWIVIATAFASSVLQNLFGFGYATLVMSVLPYVIPYHQAAAASTMGIVLLSAVVSLRDRKHIRYHIVWPALGGYLITSVGFIFLAVGTSDAALMKLLGFMLIAVSIYMTFWGNSLRIRPTARNGFLCGALGGAGAGLFAIGGPPIAIYLLSSLETKEEYRASINFYFLVGNSVGSVVRFASGAVPVQFLGWLPFIFCAMLLGSFTGNRAFKVINELTMRRVIYFFIALSGIAMLF
jgi:uncharacterized membrane protein YfcA